MVTASGKTFEPFHSRFRLPADAGGALLLDGIPTPVSSSGSGVSAGYLIGPVGQSWV
jgi:hypothetical protein